MTILLSLLGGFVALLAVLWVIVPLLSGLPWIPTHRHRIYKALDLAELKSGEIIYDLGAGDGRVLIIAALDYEAFGVGIEISPVHCLITWLRIWLSRVKERVSVRWGSMYSAEIAEADVVFVYLTSRQAQRIKPHLEKQLRVGARVVAISADIPGWEPTSFDQENLIFLYRMPPTPGGLASALVRSQNDSA